MEQILYSWTVWGKLTGRGTHPGYAQPLRNCMLNSALESGCPFSFLCRELMSIHTGKRKQPFSSRKGTEQIAEGFCITGKTIFPHQKFSVDQKILVTGDITRMLRKAEHEWEISCSKLCFGVNNSFAWDWEVSPSPSTVGYCSSDMGAGEKPSTAAWRSTCTQGREKIWENSVSPSSLQLTLSPKQDCAGVCTVLQTTEQKTANPQMRKQLGFPLPNKALSMESFPYWHKPVAEIKENKGKKQPLGGMLSALLVMPVQRPLQAAGDTSVCWRHIASPCSQGTPTTHAASSASHWCGLKRALRHTAIQLCPDICAVITSLPWGSEEKHSEFSYFYSSPLSCLKNCCPIHRICCQVVPAMAISSEQTAFVKQNT